MTEWNESSVTAMKNGQDSAFEHCYQALSPQVYSAILRICNNSQTAQDLLHDTFIDAFEKIATFDQQQNFVAWIKRIAFNNTFNLLKRQKLSFELVEQMDTDEQAPDQPEQLTVDRNLLTILLDTVPTSHRLILWLYIVEQYSHDEIGALVDKTASYSKSIVSRCLQKLKSHPAAKAGYKAEV